MNVEAIAQIAIGIAIPALGGTFAMHWRQLKEAKRQGEMELKVNTMWEFQIRRGMVEARTMNILEKNSPIKVTPHAEPYLQKFDDDLLNVMMGDIGKLDDVGQFIALEQCFGERVVEELCIPLKISQGACILSLMVYGRKLLAGWKAAA